MRLKDDAIVLRGWSCPYCGAPTQLADDSEIYGRPYSGKIWICRPCRAWVGCHRGTRRALGRVADKRLRVLKHRAHDVFDLLWKEGHMTRSEAYVALSEILGLPPGHTHIGMFDADLCRRVITISELILKNIRDGKKDRF